MKCKVFINKVDELDSCIRMFEASLECNDGSKLALTKDQEEKICEMLKDYKKMLLESQLPTT